MTTRSMSTRSMTRKLHAVLLLAAGLACAACHDDDDDGTSGSSGDALVRDLVTNNTSDSAEPIDVNDLDLQFSGDENAFSDLFQ